MISFIESYQFSIYVEPTNKATKCPIIDDVTMRVLYAVRNKAYIGVAGCMEIIIQQLPVASVQCSQLSNCPIFPTILWLLLNLSQIKKASA